MHLKQLAAASLLAVSTFAAHAVVPPDGDLGTLATKPELYGAFGGAAAPTSFSHDYSFTLSGLSDVVGSIGVVFGSVSFSDVLINGATVGALTPITTGFGFSMAGLESGNYTLTVKGLGAAGFNGYVGSIYAQPVPEPESIALMLAGLGVVGAVAARRRKAH